MSILDRLREDIAPATVDLSDDRLLNAVALMAIAEQLERIDESLTLIANFLPQ